MEPMESLHANGTPGLMLHIAQFLMPQHCFEGQCMHALQFNLRDYYNDFLLCTKATQLAKVDITYVHSISTNGYFLKKRNLENLLLQFFFLKHGTPFFFNVRLYIYLHLYFNPRVCPSFWRAVPVRLQHFILLVATKA